MKLGTLLRWYALRGILKSEVRANSIVLDVGGYDGFIVYKLIELLPNLKVIVVDLDKEGLNTAKEYGLGTLFASGCALPIQDNSADIVLCLDLIEHVEEDYKLINEISRVLKRDGKVILTTPMRDKSLIPFLDMEAINKSWGHVRNGYTLEEIESLFEGKKQLCIYKSDKYQNIFSRYAYYFAAFSRIPLRGKWRLYQAIIRLEPFIKLWAWEHVIIGRKR